jgi:hypothetical protein
MKSASLYPRAIVLASTGGNRSRDLRQDPTPIGGRGSPRISHDAANGAAAFGHRNGPAEVQNLLRSSPHRLKDDQAFAAYSLS